MNESTLPAADWLRVLALIVAAWAVGFVASKLLRTIVRRAARRTATALDDALVKNASAPVRLLVALMVMNLGAQRMHMPPAIVAPGERVLRLAILIAVFWGLWRVVSVVRAHLLLSAWGRASPSAVALVPLASRVAKGVLVAAALVSVVSALGYPVTSLLAGLGIGGIALALGAQKTLEHLFGAFSLGVDQPFREGDFVRVEDFVGTVEAIGLRSTRFRTLDRTVISIPNGRLADMRLETFAARDRIRLACDVGLVYGTTAAQMRGVVAALERVLRAHPQIWPDAVVVRFKGFGASSLDIEVMAWFLTSDWAEFQAIRQEMLLSFMDVVEREGSAFAFPTRTLHLVRE